MSRERRNPSESWPGWSMDWPPPTVVVVMAEAAGTALWNRSPDRDPFADDYVLDDKASAYRRSSRSS